MYEATLTLNIFIFQCQMFIYDDTTNEICNVKFNIFHQLCKLHNVPM